MRPRGHPYFMRVQRLTKYDHRAIEMCYCPAGILTDCSWSLAIIMSRNVFTDDQRQLSSTASRKIMNS